MKFILEQPRRQEKDAFIENPTVEQIKTIMLTTEWDVYTSVRLETDPENYMEIFGSFDIGRKIMYAENGKRFLSSGSIKSIHKLMKSLISYCHQDNRWRTFSRWDMLDEACELPDDFSLSKFILKGIFHIFKHKLFSIFGLRHREGSVVHIPDNDPEMNRAIQKAVETLPQFFSALQSNNDRYRDFTVKYKITDDGYTEHFWLRDIKKQEDHLWGYIDNQPQRIQSAILGKEVTIDMANITDWGYYDNHVGQGFYTVKAVMKNLSRSERNYLMETLGWIDNEN